MRNYLTLVGMSIIKKQTNKQKRPTKNEISVGKSVEKREPLCTVGSNVNYTATMDNTMEIP